jgi:hypothetical protein
MTYEELTRILNADPAAFKGMQPASIARPTIEDIFSGVQSQFQAPQTTATENLGYGANRFIDPNFKIATRPSVNAQATQAIQPAQAISGYKPSPFDLTSYQPAKVVAPTNYIASYGDSGGGGGGNYVDDSQFRGYEVPTNKGFTVDENDVATPNTVPSVLSFLAELGLPFGIGKGLVSTINKSNAEEAAAYNNKGYTQGEVGWAMPTPVSGYFSPANDFGLVQETPAPTPTVDALDAFLALNNNFDESETTQGQADESAQNNADSNASPDNGGYSNSGGYSDGEFAEGGYVDAGKLIGMNPAGADDGYGALDDGEYVIKASAVKKYGVGLLGEINAGKVSKKKLMSLL